MFDEPGRDGMKVHQPARHFSQPSPLPGNVRTLFLMQNIFNSETYHIEMIKARDIKGYGHGICRGREI